MREFNRLVVMVTHEGSWHSVSRNASDQQCCCVSNYYFSSQPVGEREYFHVTSFRGRPEQRARDLVLRGDIWLRMKLRELFPRASRTVRIITRSKRNVRPIGQPHEGAAVLRDELSVRTCE